jgi:hypothetical protein
MLATCHSVTFIWPDINVHPLQLGFFSMSITMGTVTNDSLVWRQEQT